MYQMTIVFKRFGYYLKIGYVYSKLIKIRIVFS